MSYDLMVSETDFIAEICNQSMACSSIILGEFNYYFGTTDVDVMTRIFLEAFVEATEDATRDEDFGALREFPDHPSVEPPEVTPYKWTDMSFIVASTNNKGQKEIQKILRNIGFKKTGPSSNIKNETEINFWVITTHKFKEIMHKYGVTVYE